MNPDANNETPGESFDFAAADRQFDDVELPTFDRDLGPAERHMVEKLERGFDVLEAGLRHTLGQIEAIREKADFEAIMRDPETADQACEFASVMDALPQGLMVVSLALHAASHGFGFCSDEDLADAS